MEGRKIGNSNLKLVNKMFPILRRGRKKEGGRGSKFSQHLASISNFLGELGGKASWNGSNFDRSFCVDGFPYHAPPMVTIASVDGHC